MNERKIAQEGYVINGFKPFSQLEWNTFPAIRELICPEKECVKELMKI